MIISRLNFITSLNRRKPINDKTQINSYTFRTIVRLLQVISWLQSKLISSLYPLVRYKKDWLDMDFDTLLLNESILWENSSF